MGRIEEAIERSENATPGPWEVIRGYEGFDVFSASSESQCRLPITDNGGTRGRDATFIARSRQDVPDFAQVLIAIRDLHFSVRKHHKDYCEQCGHLWPCKTAEILDDLDEEGTEDADRD
ncbi:MAG: hypothetical protein M0Z39_05780 [Actinomycetota bacterium]|jgi:hypothetical protein|nr:hypothetical protein [Actinomycetota bacterium]